MQNGDEHLIHEVAARAGKIMLGGSAVISCTVDDLSVAGACLLVPHAADVPDLFDLLMDEDQLRKKCGVVWRTETKVGVFFR